MADSTSRYRPRDWRRVCDICGMLRNISEMHFQDSLWVCTYDYGERVRTELDKGNARQRPFQIKPVPHPKPLDNYYPNTLETDDAAVFNFLSRMVAAQCRYERIDSGQAPFTSQGGGIPALAWAGRYFYDLIQENSRRLLIDRAKSLLKTIADYLRTRQQGFGLSPSSTVVNDAFYGGFIATSATTLVTTDAAAAGLALLYAYRIHGDANYIVSSRAAASYLRNVQAIGSNGTNYTSSDAAGTARLYTGSLASEVSVLSGFYSNSLFYPSALLALEFWNELKTTDGDQTIGSTGTPTGFTTVPAQTLSQSITDLRTCWEVGIQETTGTVVNGLSSTTPREFFNAYPSFKPKFTTAGSGMWEYFDGVSSSGTQVSAQNICLGISSLFNYEGATSQVTGLSDWLRTFTSNSAFETPANTSTSVLYRTTTGTYDPTIAISTLLQVRDPSTLAATTINATSVYDWGAFGLLSRLWASRNKASFRTSRLYPLNLVQRYYDGDWNDGLNQDRITTRGVSGLTLQTGFPGDGTDGTVSPTSSSSSTSSGSSTTMPTVGLVQMIEGDKLLTSVATRVTSWGDQSGFGQSFLQPNPGSQPYVLDTVDGVPAVSFGVAGDANKTMQTALNFKDSNGVDMDGASARTVMAVIKPRFDAAWGVTGGLFWDQSNWGAVFDLESTFVANGAYGWARAWRSTASAMQFTPIPGGAGGPFDGVPTLVEYQSPGSPTLTFLINNVVHALTPSTMPGVPGAAGPANLPDVPAFSFLGAVVALYVWDRVLPADEHDQAISYITHKFPSLPVTAPTTNPAITNDAIRSAQFGRSFREARG